MSFRMPEKQGDTTITLGDDEVLITLIHTHADGESLHTFAFPRAFESEFMKHSFLYSAELTPPQKETPVGHLIERYIPFAPSEDHPEQIEVSYPYRPPFDTTVNVRARLDEGAVRDLVEKPSSDNAPE